MNDKLTEKLAAALKNGSPIITAADIKHGVMEHVQLYFEADGEAVMDVINKDDLVQNFPDEGVFVLNKNGNLVKLVMFEGEEDMYFRTDGKTEESDEFCDVPSVTFMEAVEAISSLKL
ncbi:MAG: hypothetical protein J6R86_06020 [Lentisphaeria bacterium]|nr:hypothetical protein [Lentisphaeria bacterium]